MTTTNKNVKTKIFALGGLEEVGKNTYCIEHQNEIIIIDAGIKFANKSLLGVEVIIPDYQYLVDNAAKVKAVFITHGHEDHIGGLPYLLQKINLPNIYAPALASDLIKMKLKKDKPKMQWKINDYGEDDIFQTKYFRISFFQVTHSIPNSFGICIETPNGNIVTTGDFKIDLTPLGKATNFRKIHEFQKKGVTLMLSDSTNSEINQSNITEKEVIDTIENFLITKKKRVLVATFASNVDRIYEILLVAQKVGRKIAVIGRAIKDIIEIVQTKKYLQIKKDIFIKSSEIENYLPKQVVVLCTGSQGEEFSAVSKIADGSHPDISDYDKNVLIFSSRPIPGNRYRLTNLINQLKKKGIEVELDGPWNRVHTSGHANQEEQKLMICLFQPKYFMPMHGEYRMLKIHGQTAMKVGIPEKNVFICKNGDRLLMFKNTIIKKEAEENRAVYIASDKSSEDTLAILHERQMMMQSGFVGVGIKISREEKKILETPQIVDGGCFSKKESNLRKELQNFVKEKINLFLKTQTLIEKNLKTMIIKEMSEFIYKNKRMAPLITVVMVVKNPN